MVKMVGGQREIHLPNREDMEIVEGTLMVTLLLFCLVRLLTKVDSKALSLKLAEGKGSLPSNNLVKNNTVSVPNLYLAFLHHFSTYQARLHLAGPWHEVRMAE